MSTIKYQSMKMQRNSQSIKKQIKREQILNRRMNAKLKKLEMRKKQIIKKQESLSLISKKDLIDENNTLKTELFIVKEQLMNSQKIREEIYEEWVERYDDAVHRIRYNANIVDRLHDKCSKIYKELESSRAEQKYQRRQKINTRKRFRSINDKYKKAMMQNELLETKLSNIQKTIEGITKNTKMNIMKYFQKEFPKIEKTDCNICCDSFESNKIKEKSICKNGCNISICEGCFDELKCCPYCKQVYEKKYILSYDDEDYESEGEDDFDYLEERNSETVPVEQMVQEMFTQNHTTNNSSLTDSTEMEQERSVLQSWFRQSQTRNSSSQFIREIFNNMATNQDNERNLEINLSDDTSVEDSDEDSDEESQNVYYGR